MLTMILNGKICLNIQGWRWWLLHVASVDATGSFVQEVKRWGSWLVWAPTERDFVSRWKGFWCRELPPGERTPQNPFLPQLPRTKSDSRPLQMLSISYESKRTPNKNYIICLRTLQSNFLIICPSRMISKWTGWNVSYWGVILNSSFIIQLIKWSINSICQYLKCIMLWMHYLLYVMHVTLRRVMSEACKSF